MGLRELQRVRHMDSVSVFRSQELRRYPLFELTLV